MTHNDDPNQMRRNPRQARGRQRVEQILDAAEQLFAEGGYEAASTNQIAAQAGVPIGSVYQFFPNKESILHGVAARYRSSAASALDAALGPETTTMSAMALAERLLEAMVAFGAARMGFTRLVLQAGAHPQLASAATGVMDEAAARLETVLACRAPELPPERRALVARVALTATMALLGVVVAEKSRGSVHTKALLAEAERLLGAYLQTTLPA